MPWGKADQIAQTAYMDEMHFCDEASTSASEPPSPRDGMSRTSAAIDAEALGLPPPPTLLKLLATKRGPSRASVIEAVAREGKGALQDLNPQGWQPLLVAVQRGHTEAAVALLELDAEVECRDPSSGWTPLMFAVTLGKERAVEALLARGASVNAFAQPHDWNPLSAAIMSNREDIVGMLLDAGGDLQLLKRRHPDQAATYASFVLRVQESREANATKDLEPCMWVRDYDLHT